MSDTPPRHFQLPAGRGRGTKRPAEQDLSSSSSSSSSRDTSSSHGSSRDLTWSNTSTINLSSSSNDTITLSSGSCNNTIWLSSDEEPRPGASGSTADHGGRRDAEGDSDAPTHSWTSSCDRGHEPSSSSSEGRAHWYQEYLNSPRELDQEAIAYWEEAEREDPPAHHSRQQKKKK
jgi:hypothetical protein